MSDTSEPDEDGYRGPATLEANGRRVEVEVTLTGHFEPITGKYRWYGRVAASPEVAELLGDASKKVVLTTPHGSVETALSDVDPWGRPRVEGFGRAPFEVLDSVAD
jgi:hypothetical protein